MQQEQVLLDIHTLVVVALGRVFGDEVEVIAVPDANNQTIAPLISASAVPVQAFQSGPAGAGWTFQVTFRVTETTRLKAFHLMDKLYRAVHAFEDDGVFVEGVGHFGAVEDSIPPRLTGSTILPGAKNVTEYLAAFSIVATN